MEHFARLNTIAQSDLSGYFSGSCTSSVFEDLCKDIMKSLSYLLDPSEVSDLDDSVIVQFLRGSLPILVELILRRKSQMYGCQPNCLVVVN